MVEKDYTSGWREVIAELQRIGRFMPDNGAHPDVAQVLLLQLEWDKVFDFCERLYSQLTRDVYRENGETGEWELRTAKSKVQEYVANELQRLFLEEKLAFEFSNGLVLRRGRRNTTNQISRAGMVLGEPRLLKALNHFNKALKYFRDVSNPDFENVVKEAVCAVEATARALFPSEGSTLGDVVKSITGSGKGQLPKPIAKTFEGLYGFRSAGEGVGHGGSVGGPVTKELAEYALALAASQIVFLVGLDIASDSEVPF